jgi:nucleotide-binding universal stress UspA family protein
MLRLVIPVDGSEASHRAIEAAVRLAKETMVEVVLVHVREGAATYHGDLTPLDYQRIGEQERERQVRVLDDALEHARRIGLERVSAQPEAGAPDVEIPRVVTDLGADMIIMGTRGLGAVGALLLGSVAQRVVHSATVPVLLVK